MRYWRHQGIFPACSIIVDGSLPFHVPLATQIWDEVGLTSKHMSVVLPEPSRLPASAVPAFALSHRPTEGPPQPFNLSILIPPTSDQDGAASTQAVARCTGCNHSTAGFYIPLSCSCIIVQTVLISLKFVDAANMHPPRQQVSQVALERE